MRHIPFRFPFKLIFLILLCTSVSLDASIKNLPPKLLVDISPISFLHAKDETIVPVRFTITNESDQTIRIPVNPGSTLQINIYSLEHDGSKVELYPHNMKLNKNLPLMVGSRSAFDLKPGQSEAQVVNIPFQVFDYPDVQIFAAIKYCFMTQKNGALLDENEYDLSSSPITTPPHAP